MGDIHIVTAAYLSGMLCCLILIPIAMHMVYKIPYREILSRDMLPVCVLVFILSWVGVISLACACLLHKVTYTPLK